ncbi:MAG: sigma-70 family RNA polymerase sigma factor [Pseudomonadota bacterium]
MIASRGDDDRALIGAIARGDRKAFDALYRRYHGPLSAFVLKTTRRADLVDDVVNEAMLVIWRSAARFEGRSTVRTWIFGVGYRCGLNAMRAQRKADADAPLEDEVLGTAGAVPAKADEVIARETMARALATLSPEQRAVIELTYYFGYSVAEVADIVDCPAGTVKTRMLAARRRLHQVLGESGGASDG